MIIANIKAIKKTNLRLTKQAIDILNFGFEINFVSLVINFKFI